MKAILMSDRPKWCALMMNGKKKVEVRKGTALYKAIQKLIDEYGYADIYVYCTKGKEKLYDDFPNVCSRYKSSKNYILNNFLNGEVIFKFRCYKVEEWHSYSWQEITKNACLTDDELKNYSKGVSSLYCIHITDLVIFDKPKELSEFYTLKCDQKKEPCNIKDVFGVGECHRICKMCKPLTKAPQSFAYIEVGE